MVAPPPPVAQLLLAPGRSPPPRPGLAGLLREGDRATIPAVERIEEATVPDGPGVRVERDGPVTVVTIDRPERRNAVDGPAAAALAGAFRDFDRDPGASVAVLTGAGGAFCAGADLKAIAAGQPPRVAADGDGPMGPTRLRLSKPVLAAIEGPAVRSEERRVGKEGRTKCAT